MHSPPSAIGKDHWHQLLEQAVHEPGILSSAYSAFWSFSLGNQLLALFECMRRGLPLGPLHTFNGWRDMGRYVKRGEKGITLCMPVQIKRRRKQRDADSRSESESSRDMPPQTVFVFRAFWFVLAQTDGKDYVPTELPSWSETLALLRLKIERVPFKHLDGNCQGYATKDRKIAVSPVAALPHKTLLHELAHVVLGHTEEGDLSDDERTPRALREVEAECVALLCIGSLQLPGLAESRGYVQHWLQDKKSISEHSAKRIFAAANDILKAGLPEESIHTTTVAV